MEFSTATVTLKSLSPYSQSREHESPRLEGETHDAYDKRTAIEKGHYNAAGHLVIPATAMHQAICMAGQYSKKQIKGQGKATWTAKLKAGLAITENIDMNIPKAQVDIVRISCDSMGRTGTQAKSRVPRHFPQVPAWQATFEIFILDPIITEDILVEMINTAGLFVGIGRWRPIMNGGQNGRFTLTNCVWSDKRQLVSMAA